jgi:hypothetical protein
MFRGTSSLSARIAALLILRDVAYDLSCTACFELFSCKACARASQEVDRLPKLIEKKRVEELGSFNFKRIPSLFLPRFLCLGVDSETFQFYELSDEGER